MDVSSKEIGVASKYREIYLLLHIIDKRCRCTTTPDIDWVAHLSRNGGNFATKHVIILVVTITGKGDKPRYSCFKYPSLVQTKVQESKLTS